MQSLQGKTILITRSKKRAEHLLHHYTSQGAKIIHIPLVETKAPSDHFASLDSALKHLHDYDCLLFTSQTAVEAFFTRPSAPSAEELSCRVFAVGPQTKAFLEKLGVQDIEMGTVSSSEGLLQHLKQFDLEGKRILFPRAKDGSDVLIDGVKRKGGNIIFVEAYQTEFPKDFNKEAFLKLLQGDDVDYIHFSSPSAVNHFCAVVKGQAWNEHHIQFFTLGETTKEALQQTPFAHLLKN
ncbi:MAG: hypothetical protein COX62_05105 [Deltaproteobacteria bacterium CG_4_10_14_0_2_um_filter_43_8]|nr:MAG: hypothetical protein COV43_09560 [Deltaproteobacteria bacterium CG11_big_fil_rev_8_21_14_0_20_42_23]PJA20198.1 MAG: hypothetical protein COX62_05105 [Deltaproteobacteria bacterium CG_4_10_14_0_2_um_filter_43_8]PJC64335.1 MAG: hypothetical protein CO021_04845 [Deltaproteobacteria bacterium CG_4_9_14_0_2_um_filter_42_21]